MTEISPTTKLLSVREFAARQGWSEYQVLYRVRQFNFPHVPMGRRILIPENAVELLMQEQEGR